MSNQINDIMATSLSNIKEIIDVNTVIGDAVQTPDGAVIIPICKICFGIATGGAEYNGAVNFSDYSNNNDKKPEESLIIPVKYPFAGGCATGISITPTAFIKSSGGEISLINIESENAVEKLLNLIPDLSDKIFKIFEDKNSRSQKESGNSNLDLEM